MGRGRQLEYVWNNMNKRVLSSLCFSVFTRSCFTIARSKQPRPTTQLQNTPLSFLVVCAHTGYTTRYSTTFFLFFFFLTSATRGVVKIEPIIRNGRIHNKGGRGRNRQPFRVSIHRTTPVTVQGTQTTATIRFGGCRNI